jgi:hypothetical protein
MWRLLIIVSVVPMAAGLVLRWWFGLRALQARGRLLVRPDGGRWLELAGGGGPELSAGEAGARLRAAALREWMAAEPRSAKAREGARRFGVAVPPLSMVVAAMGVIAGRVPVMVALAGVLAAVALATVFGLLSLGSELRVIAATAKRVRDARMFRRSDDEEAVIECAAAHAWNEAVPPVLRWLK